MAKQTIQTNLLGEVVRIGEETGTQYGPDGKSAGKVAKIRNVYLDKDGDPKYTLEVIESGRLVDFYPCHFTISTLK